MKTILLVISTLVSSAIAADLEGFHVKWKLIDPFRSDSYYEIPRTSEDAISGGWEVTTSDSHTTSSTIYCQPDDGRFCILMDAYGHICGVQIGLLVSDVGNLSGLTEINLYKEKTMFDQQWWTCTVYTVDPEIINAGGRKEWNGLTGSGEVWFETTYGYYYVPKNLPDLSSDWTKESCYGGMGQHYFYALNSTTKCETIWPWSLLYQDDQISGVIFESFGTTSYKKVKWFEWVPSWIIKLVFPTSPDCMTEWTADKTAITLHIYWTANPWTFKCP